MTIPIIFVVGPLSSGKTRLVNELPVRYLPSTIQRESKAKFGKKVSDFIRVPFNTNELVNVFQLQASGIIDDKITITACMTYMLENLKKAVEVAKAKSTNDKLHAVIIEHNLIYYVNEWDVNISLDLIMLEGPLPNKHILVELLKMDALPLCTFRLPMEEENDMAIRHGLVYRMPSKNTGPFIYAPLPKIQLNKLKGYPTNWTVDFIGEFRPAVEHKPILEFYDGHIGSGKTSIMNKFTADIGTIAITEPMQRISKLLTLEIPDTIKRSIIEAGINNVNFRKLDKFIELNKESNFSLERNWLYSAWVFGAIKSDYPVIDLSVYNEFRKRGLIIGTTYYIDLSIKESKKRMIKRGRKCDMSWDDKNLQEIYDRLKILYTSPLEWPYARVCVISNDEDESEDKSTIEPKDKDIIVNEDTVVEDLIVTKNATINKDVVEDMIKDVIEDVIEETPANKNVIEDAIEEIPTDKNVIEEILINEEVPINEEFPINEEVPINE